MSSGITIHWMPVKRLRCKVCGFRWTPKTEHPRRCGRHACRSMLWDGHERILPNYRHGYTNTPTYRTWVNMKNRCASPNNPRWKDYGGAGIKLDPRWYDFENFLKDMGERPQGKTLDRYPDPHGNYTKKNCRWATPQQQQNNMRNNRLETFNGHTQTLADWARELGVNTSTLRKRIDRGWTIERAFTETPQPKNGAKK